MMPTAPSLTLTSPTAFWADSTVMEKSCVTPINLATLIMGNWMVYYIFPFTIMIKHNKTEYTFPIIMQVMSYRGRGMCLKYFSATVRWDSSLPGLYS